MGNNTDSAENKSQFNSQDKGGEPSIQYVAIDGLWASEGKYGGPEIEYEGEIRRVYDYALPSEGPWVMDEIGANLIGEYHIEGITLHGEGLQPFFNLGVSDGTTVEIYSLSSEQLEELDSREELYDSGRVPLIAKQPWSNEKDIEVWVYQVESKEEIALNICREAEKNNSVRTFRDDEYTLIAFYGLYTTLGVMLSNHGKVATRTSEYGLAPALSNGFNVFGNKIFPDLIQVLEKYK